MPFDVFIKRLFIGILSGVNLFAPMQIKALLAFIIRCKQKELHFVPGTTKQITRP
jgi:hypothetical protein